MTLCFDFSVFLELFLLRKKFLILLNNMMMFQMNVSVYGGEFDSDGRYMEGLETDSRLMDAAETLVTLQTSDLVSGTGSNNPLFGTNIQLGTGNIC